MVINWEKYMIELILILDRSGSMAGREESVIKGYNDFIEEQKKLDGDACVTTVLFDDQYEIVCDRVPVQEVKMMNSEIYSARGLTSLYDAIGRTLARAETSNKGILMVFTDGHENNSKEYRRPAIKMMVEDLKGLDWEVAFVGAGIDAFSEAGKIGIDKDSVLKVDNTAQGITASSHYLSTRSAEYRTRNS